MPILKSVWRIIQDLTRVSWTGIRPDDFISYSWARRIETYEDVPNRFEPFFRPLRTDGTSFPYTLQTPSYTGFLHPTTEKILCLRKDKIYVLEQWADSYLETCFPIRDVYWIEFGSILLSSWFRIRGRSESGQLSDARMKFNSITDHLFAPVLEKVRIDGFGKILPLHEGNPGIQDLSSRLTFKFGNYLKRSLLPGDRIHHAVFQPEIRSIRLTFLGRAFHRTLSTTHLCLLTERELIVIREEASRSEKTRYGGIWNYLPLERIQKLSIQKRENELITLSIQLPDDIRWDLLFQSSLEPDLVNFLDIAGKHERTSS